MSASETSSAPPSTMTMASRLTAMTRCRSWEIISTAQPHVIAEKIINAGSIFIGHLSPESVGDYASGTNHTLPTNGYARNYSGVSLDSFVTKITFQELSRDLGIAPQPSTPCAAAR